MPDHHTQLSPVCSPISSPLPATGAGVGLIGRRGHVEPLHASSSAVGTEDCRLASAIRHAVAVDAATAAAAAANGSRGATDHLDRLLSSMPAIEQSKGLLMGYYGVDAETAYAILRRWSSTANIKLNQLCEQLTTAAAQPGQEPFAGLRAVLDLLACVSGYEVHGAETSLKDGDSSRRTHPEDGTSRLPDPVPFPVISAGAVAGYGSHRALHCPDS